MTNTTGTELEILKNLENAYRTANGGDKAKRNTAKSLDWFRKYVTKNYSGTRTSQFLRDQKLFKQKFMMGKMYLANYSAKHADTLPIWDKWPLFIPFSMYKSKAGNTIVIGINFHYLKPQHRMIAFKALLQFRNEKRFRKSTKFNFDWQLISAIAESKYYKHAVHSYDIKHFHSLFVEIPAQSYELVLFMPLARWAKGTNAEAWKI